MNETQNINLVTIEQMSEMLQTEPYQPDQEENVPQQLLRDEETGLLYTDFFCNLGTNLLLSHILVEQLFDNYEQVDWSIVSNNYEPHIISRMAGLYTHPLVWTEIPKNVADKYIVTGRFAEEQLVEERFNDECFGVVIGIETQEKRAKFFVDTLPTFQPNSSSPLEPNPVHRWDMLLIDNMELILADIDHKNPYHKNMNVNSFDVNIFKDNLENLPEDKQYEIICLLRKEWNSIIRQRLFGINDDNIDELDDFHHFLFDILQDFVERHENQQEKVIPQHSEVNLEDTFSLRFRRTDEYKRLLEFLEIERTEASDGDWTRYALAMMDANIFIHRPKTFKNWLPKFCHLFGRNVTYQEPNKLKRTACQRDIKIYLPDW